MPSKKILLTVGAAVLILALLLIFKFTGPKSNQENPPITSQTTLETQKQFPETASPKATGNISDIVDALVAGALAEESASETEDDETSLVDIDSQEINAFTQTYDEKEL